MKQMKIYTKKGDAGETGLLSGVRVPKSELVFDVVGGLDEVSSHVGLICVSNSCDSATRRLLRFVQSKLLDIGADVANPNNDGKYTCDLTELTTILEKKIDEMESTLPRLTQFILPGTDELNARIHLCRSVIRRVERDYTGHVRDAEREFHPSIACFLNRLSDYLFVLARHTVHGNDVHRITSWE